MKTRWIIMLIAVVAVGLVAGQAGAAIECTVSLLSLTGEHWVALTSDGNATFNVWAYIAGANGSTADDGVSQLYGKLVTTNGGVSMRGDLAFFADPAFTNITPNGFSNGTIQDLDGDGDKDVGGKSNTIQGGVDGNWIYTTPGGGGVIATNDGNRVLLGKAIFTTGAVDGNTVATWGYWPKTGIPQTVHIYRIDNLNRTVGGTSANLANEPINIIPEPMTMAILGVGGLAGLVLRRRRRV